MATELELLEKQYTDLCIKYDIELEVNQMLRKQGRTPKSPNSIDELNALMRKKGKELARLLDSCGEIVEKARYKAHLTRKKELNKLKKENDKNEDQLVSTQRATHNLIVAELTHLSYLLIYYKC